jgi:hypothetical protein
MELSGILIRQTEKSGFEAEFRGDYLINGDNGCWISIVGWGATEADARRHLRVALDEMKVRAG